MIPPPTHIILLKPLQSLSLKEQMAPPMLYLLPEGGVGMPHSSSIPMKGLITINSLRLTIKHLRTPDPKERKESQPS
jgi:hypothetical protein